MDSCNLKAGDLYLYLRPVTTVKSLVQLMLVASRAFMNNITYLTIGLLFDKK